MDIKKLAPWNWFKKEDEHHGKAVTPVRYNRKAATRGPRYPLDVFDEMERFLGAGLEEDLWSSFNLNLPVTPLSDPGLLRPYVDIGASSTEYTITVEIPGVSDNDIQLELSDNTLIIKGEKRQEQTEQQKDFYRVERSYGSFQRVLSLPDDAESDNIQALFKNGVLNITIPRKELPATKAKPKAIPIREAG